MKNLSILFIFLGSLTFSYSQPPNYDDLVVYFADGEYEKLLKKAEKYTVNDKTRNDALPYLFLSKANYEVSKGHELLEKYPRAFKDAVNYAGKCIQKDKEGNVQKEYLGHFNNLKKALYEELRLFVENADYGRMAGYLPMMDKIDKDDIGTRFLKSAAQHYRKDKAGMRETIKQAEELLKNAEQSKFTIDEKNDDIDVIDRKKIDLDLLKLGVFEYCKVMIEIRQADKAKDILGKIAQWYANDKEFKAKYDEIVN